MERIEDILDLGEDWFCDNVWKHRSDEDRDEHNRKHHHKKRTRTITVDKITVT